MLNDEFNLLVAQTGGTIDKQYPKSVGGYAFEITECAANRILTKFNIGFKFGVISVTQKDSQDISDADRNNLVSILSKTTSDRILVTHGTDTLIQTAKFLAGVASLSKKTIVFTGSFLPECFKDSDADFNIGVAVGALQCIPCPGVYVAMNGVVSRWDEVSRDMKSGKFFRDVSLRTRKPAERMDIFYDKNDS